MEYSFEEWWHSEGSEKWAKFVDIEPRKAIEMVFNAGRDGYRREMEGRDLDD